MTVIDTDPDPADLVAAVEDLRRRQWTDQAACRGVEPDLFFPARGEDYRTARAVCDRCPVAQQCLDYALDNREKFGIWGGTTERQRRQIRRSRPTPPDIHGTRSRYRAGCRCGACREANNAHNRHHRRQGSA